MKTLRTILFLLICLLISANCSGQDILPDNYKPPFGELPELKLGFLDDFSKDTRKKYIIRGQKNLKGIAKWSPGTIVLEPGTTLKRSPSSGSWIELEFDLEFPEVTKENPLSSFKAWLFLGDRPVPVARFKQAWSNGKPKSQVAIDIDGKKRGNPGWPFGKIHTLNGRLPNGKWKLRFRSGLVELQSPEKKIRIIGFQEYGDAQVYQLCFKSIKGTTKIRQLRLLRSPRIAYKPTAKINSVVGNAFAQTQQCVQLYRGGKSRQAIPIAKKVLETHKKYLGRFHPEYTSAVSMLAVFHKKSGEFDKAEPLYREALDLRQKICGREHPSTATVMNNYGNFLAAIGKFDESEALQLEAMAIRKKILGAKDPAYSLSQANLATLYRKTEDYEKAIPLYADSLLRMEESLGKRHPNYVTALINLAMLHDASGDPRRSVLICLEAKKLAEKTFKKNHPIYGQCLNSLATGYVAIGAFEKAEPLLLESVDICAEVFGKKHYKYAAALSSFARFYVNIGEHEKALELWKECLEIEESQFGKNHINYATALSNLAVTYLNLQQYEDAASNCKEAKDVLLNTAGKAHGLYSTLLNTEAAIYQLQGDFQKAQPLFVEARRLHEKLVGKRHSLYARSTINLAANMDQLGDLAGAEPLYLEVKTLLEKTSGKRHPDYTNNLGKLGLLYHAMKRYEKAQSYMVEALQINRDNLELYSQFQTENRQLKFARASELFVSILVTNALKLPDRGPAVWEQLARWKGISLVRQKENLTLASRPETKSDFLALRRIRSQISRHLQSSTNSPNWTSKMDQLLEREELADKKLSKLTAELKLKTLENIPHEIKIPRNTCLVDFRKYTHFEIDSKRPNKYQTEPRYLAMVKRPDKSVQLVDLGSSEKIEKVISRWRAPIEDANQTGRFIETAEQKVMEVAGRELRSLLWTPLEGHFATSELIIISPDGALGRLPLIALPGKTPGSFLLEEKKIVYLPVPALLPKILDSPARRLTSDSNALLLGNITYGDVSTAQSPNQLAFRNNRILKKLHFQPLANSGVEVNRINSLFNNATRLTEKSATEKAFLQGLRNKQIVHIATHGFFQSPNRFRKIIASQDGDSFVSAKQQAEVLIENPNLLSGLALANANSASEKSMDESAEDGILYSAEIAMMPMAHVELAVLSACETSLGTDDNPGEGLIGIQRAFQVAGVKSTIASYWKVDDRATQLLMNRFYKNLIEFGEKSKSKQNDFNLETVRIDALIEAQRWMLRGLNKEQVAQLSPRGIDDETPVKDIKLKKSSDTKKQKLEYISHPRYWAAFVLSGDWR